MTTTAAPPVPPAPPTGSPRPTDRAEPRPSPARIERLVGIILALVALGLVATQLIPLPAVVVSLPFLYLLIFKPVLRRLAMRNASRRPRETLLIVLGAMLGTAVITSSLVVGDTLTASIHRSVYTQLGPVDEVVLSPGPVAGQRVAAVVEGAKLRNVDGTLPLLTLQAAVSSSGALPKAQPQTQVIEVDFAQARAFGGDPAATGMSGATPTGDNAVIGADLAMAIGARPGERITVYAYGATRTFVVNRVLPRLGIAGLAPLQGFTGSESFNLFVPPGTLTTMQTEGPAGSRSAPPISVLAVSNTGNVTSGAHLTTQVTGELNAALRGVPAQVQQAKQDLINVSNQVGSGLSSLFQVFGLFAVAVGVLLLINIFVMLAQERKQTLGMLRAVGLRRASLVGSFSLEGWMYTVVSALAGMAVGVGIGRLVITAASRIFNQAGGHRAQFILKFSVRASSLHTGFFVGFLIATITVVCTSLYVALLNVIRAIRDLPEPRQDRPRSSTLVFGLLFSVAGIVLTVAGIAAAIALPALAGPAILGFGVCLLSLGRAPTRPTVSIASAVVLVWAIVAPGLLSHAFSKSGLDVFFVQGLVLNVFAVLLITFNQSTIGAAIRALGGGARNMSLRLGLSYPLAKRFRTGLLLAMYAIVMFVLVLLTTISQFFSGQVNDQIRKVGGGAAIVVDSNAAEPVPASGITLLSHSVTGVAETSAVDADFRIGAADEPTSDKFSTYTTVGFGNDFIGRGAPTLHTWSSHYASADATYRAVATDPSLIIVGMEFGARGFGPGGKVVTPGTVVTMRDNVTGQLTRLTVAGIVSNGADQYDATVHVFVSRTLSTSAFGARASSNLLYVSTAAGTDNDTLAAQINGRYVANGANATSFHKLVNDQFSVQNEFLTLIRGYVALGLLVGIAGLGVVMVRAVRERRREVGVLRSLGFTSVAVRRAFLAESSFIALEGILIGAGLALITAWRLVESGNFGSGTSFAVPWAQLALLVVVTYVASLLATLAPAVQASRIRPAVALRITD